MTPSTASLDTPNRIDELERLVSERSAELAWANERLVAELYDRSAAEAVVSELQRFDPTTGLPNRRSFETRLERAVGGQMQGGEPAAVLCVGIGQLQEVRDSFGFAAGDAVARVVADRLRLTVRGSDTVARVGDDEFALLLLCLRQAQDAATVARKIFDVLDAPVPIDGLDIRIAPNVGVAVFPEDASTPDLLLARSSAAMQYARENGTGLYQFFRADIAQRFSRRLGLESELRAALERDEFRVHYQPRVDLKSDRVIGAEALVRWQHPARGLLEPAEFLDVAEDTALIVPIGETVLRAACSEAARWPVQMTVAVNLSVREFRGKSMLAMIEDTLQSTGLAPARVRVEITEASLARPADEEPDVLARLRSVGVQVALDNFGVGAASLAVLRHFDVDCIKIDGQFVRNALESRRDALIAGSVASLGKRLGLRVAAEGVETAAQLAFVRKIGCTEAQGFYLGRPMAGEEFHAFVDRPDRPRRPARKPAQPIAR